MTDTAPRLRPSRMENHSLRPRSHSSQVPAMSHAEREALVSRAVAGWVPASELVSKVFCNVSERIPFLLVTYLVTYFSCLLIRRLCVYYADNTQRQAGVVGQQTPRTSTDDSLLTPTLGPADNARWRSEWGPNEESSHQRVFFRCGVFVTYARVCLLFTPTAPDPTPRRTF